MFHVPIKMPQYTFVIIIINKERTSRKDVYGCRIINFNDLRRVYDIDRFNIYPFCPWIILFSCVAFILFRAHRFIQGNINDPGLTSKIRDSMISAGMNSLDVSISDAMIKTSGNYDRDHYGSYLLCENVMERFLF